MIPKERLDSAWISHVASAQKSTARTQEMIELKTGTKFTQQMKFVAVFNSQKSLYTCACCALAVHFFVP